MITNYIGQPQNRVDGPAKVRGSAKYAAEYNVPELAYGVVVSSAIARGDITSIDASKALALDGVLQVFTHKNAPRAAWRSRKYQDDVAPPGSPFRPLHDKSIVFSGQPVALVVAESFELARYAASLVHVTYRLKPHVTDLKSERSKAYKPKQREAIDPPSKPKGDARRALARADVKVDVEYFTPVEHHNPMENFATTVLWEPGGRLTIYEKTQGSRNNHKYVCNVFGLPSKKVRVISRFMGGGFGSGLRPQYQLFLAVMAARELKRSVRVSLTRQQMFTFGHRPETIQRVALGADKSGRLQALIHEAMAETSRFEDFTENVVNWAGALYRCDNFTLSHKVAQLDLYTPLDMRAPGAAWGVFALESAMDELAWKLNMDPLELRLKNYAEKNYFEEKPISSKSLRQCYEQAAARFGWSRRRPEARSTRVGDNLIGMGMSSGVWEANQEPAAARAVLTDDGRLNVYCATADIGTGTYTIMTQIAADSMGLPVENVTFNLGDSHLPNAPVEGGSFTAATVGTAVHSVCLKLRKKVFFLTRKMKGSPFLDADLEEVSFKDGVIRLDGKSPKSMAISEVMRACGAGSLEASVAAVPNKLKQGRFARYAYSAVFAQVQVDEELGTIHVNRVVSAVAAGKIINPKTARSQIMGGIVWGIGMALEEETLLDQNLGRFMNHNLAEYHVPVNADIRDIEVIFIDERDSIVNPLGVKGVGELGIVGVAAAIGNAVYHATGKRIRDLPITLDKVFF